MIRRPPVSAADRRRWRRDAHSGVDPASVTIESSRSAPLKNSLSSRLRVPSSRAQRCIHHRFNHWTGFMKTHIRRGFTLIELLVVIAIIALLVAMLLPAVQQVREAARKSQCQDHLHNLAVALHDYEASFSRFPPGWVGAANGQHDIFGNNGFGWGALTLPFIEQRPLYDQLDLDRSIVAPVNLPLLKTSIDVFICPSDPQPETWEIEAEGSPGTVLATLASANYVGVFGSGPAQPGGVELHDCELDYENNGPGSQCRSNGLLYHNGAVRMADITDGTSNTLAIGERLTIPHGSDDRHHSTWSGVVPEGEEAMARVLGLTDHTPNSNNSVTPHLDDFSSHHHGGVQFATCDGRVRFLGENLNHDVYQWLSTINGGEVAQVP
jgi:prepilin-type N-terminal cleavage/methylation domain-containing protein